MGTALGWAYRVSDEHNSSRDECGQFEDGVHRPAERFLHCLQVDHLHDKPFASFYWPRKESESVLTMIASRDHGCQPSKSFAMASRVMDSTHGPSNTLLCPGIYLMASTLTDFPPAMG